MVSIPLDRVSGAYVFKDSGVNGFVDSGSEASTVAYETDPVTPAAFLETQQTGGDGKSAHEFDFESTPEMVAESAPCVAGGSFGTSADCSDFD